LGNLVADVKPDHVICIGDWADMPSLCSYERGTKGFEGRRYKKDIESSIDAQERFFEPIRARKKKLPKFWMLHGNHEIRISRAIDSDAARLDGIISLDDLSYREYGWEVVSYSGATPGILELDGIVYAHYHTSGVLGKSIGGIHPAFQLLQKGYCSSTQGHVHTFDHCVRTRNDGSYIHGLVSGCFIDYFADFAGVANNMWWRGVCLKEDVNKGNYDLSMVSLDSIRREYSK
jgi:hypothetical protein